MSTSSDMRVIEQRHSVSTQAEVAESASLAAMAIHALLNDSSMALDGRLTDSVRAILKRIDQLTMFKAAGNLSDFLDSERVAYEAVEPASVMARIASMGNASESTPSSASSAAAPIRGIDRLISMRDGVRVIDSDGSVRIVNIGKARKLAAALDDLAEGVLTSAREEDQSRVSNNTVA